MGKEERFEPRFGEPEYIENGEYVYKVRQLCSEGDVGHACDASLIDVADVTATEVEGMADVLEAIAEQPNEITTAQMTFLSYAARDVAERLKKASKAF